MEKTLSEGRVQAGDLPALAGVDTLESAAMVEESWHLTGGWSWRLKRWKYDGAADGGWNLAVVKLS